jgi:DNA-binding CsgD family transcriptional regulator
VTRSARLARAEHDAIRLCHSGSDSRNVRQDVVRAVRRIIPVDAVFFATADPETLLFTGAWSEEPLDTAADLFLENELRGGDVNRFTALATSGRHVASLDEATRGDRRASGRYVEIMRPLGLGDELRAALVADGMCWGYVCLHRTDKPAGFTPAEAAALTRLAPHLGHALRNAVLLRPSSTPEPGLRPGPTLEPGLRPGVVLLAEDLSVVAITPDAEQLLSLIEPDRPGRHPLPMVVYAVAAALRAIVRDTSPPPHTATLPGLPSSRVLTAAGLWLNVHASRLSGPPDAGQLVVILEPVEPRATVPLILSAYGLTTREAEVARLVLRGQPTNAIADVLHISRHTVQDHLKSVFDKTGVHSRRDLVGHLLSPPQR